MRGRSRRILLASVGSYGDVFPFLALGEVLRARGHDVTILTSGYFAKLVESSGLKIAPVGSTQQYLEYISNPRLVHPIHGLLLTRRMLTSILRPVFEYLRDNWQSENALVVASPYCMAARIAQEAFQLPLVTLCPAPIAMGSVLDPPTVSSALSPARLPQWLQRAFGRSVRAVTDRLIGKPVNAFRKTCGLSEMRSLMSWWHSERGTISLFPDWFAPASPDWPAIHHFAGFPICTPQNLLAERCAANNAKLQALLANPHRPLLFYPGSNAGQLKDYFNLCAEVCRTLGRAGILVAPAATDLADRSSAHLLVTPFVSMHETLPRVQVAIHHGGIGTIAACFYAGIPQLIRPMFSDQPDNAVHVARLGAGTWMSNRHFKVVRVVQAVKQLIDDPKIDERCEYYFGRMRELNGLAHAADLIGSMV